MHAVSSARAARLGAIAPVIAPEPAPRAGGPSLRPRRTTRRPGRSAPGVAATALIIAALGCAPALLSAADTARNNMADAMARMMEAMGLLGDDQPGGAMPMDPANLAAPDIMPDMMNGVDQMFRQMPGLQQMPRIPGMPGWQRTTLEGIWEGRSGALFIVQSPRFRLYSSQGGYVDGFIQQRGDRIALYDPRQDNARPYEFAEHQGRLVLRDPAGQVYLYRRLWLDEDAGLTPPR